MFDCSSIFVVVMRNVFFPLNRVCFPFWSRRSQHENGKKLTHLFFAEVLNLFMARLYWLKREKGRLVIKTAEGERERESYEDQKSGGIVS